jgi:hypothetical protein
LGFFLLYPNIDLFCYSLNFLATLTNKSLTVVLRSSEISYPASNMSNRAYGTALSLPACIVGLLNNHLMIFQTFITLFGKYVPMAYPGNLNFIIRSAFVLSVLATKVLDISVLVEAAILLGYGICSGRDVSNG